MYPEQLLVLAILICTVKASWYDEAEVEWNLNANQDATNPLEYSIPEWPARHKYHPSPTNWRFPFYSFFLDRLVNGDPTNDNANGTSWEHDLHQTQLRGGGDIAGLVDSLDYIHGLGIRGIYIVGSAFINLPWEYDSFSPRDHTILDHHYGKISEWRIAIEAIHARGMYVVLENTMATMSDLFGFEKYYNSSAPFSFDEHSMNYVTEMQYRDYSHNNSFLVKCPIPYPRFWDQGGHLYHDNNTAAMVGCMDSEFDQYGSIGAFGQYPEWQKQLSNFNDVQDRLRDWSSSVLDKINHLSCMTIQGLDIDGFRIDKAVEVTVDSQGNFSKFQRQCASRVGKTNFIVAGEVVNGNADSAIYIGRGKTPSMKIPNTTSVTTLNSHSHANQSIYIRERGHNGLDGAVFHYSTYRALMRFLGLDGDLLAADDTSVNFQTQWDDMMQTNDMSNAITGEFDPRHFFGVSDQDVLRWPGLTNGTERQLLGNFIVTFVMPGIPIISWGEEQLFYTLENTASNYIFGRQPMSSTLAWQMHGCYKVGDTNLVDAPFNSSLTACEDDSVSLDHRDPSHPAYGLLKHMFELRQKYPVLNDGWNVQQLSEETFQYILPGSLGVPTETGLWSVLRGRIESVQDFTGIGMHGNQGVWLLYSNYNDSIVYESNCTGHDQILSPYDAGTVVKNLFYPFDEWTLAPSGTILGIEGSTNLSGCLSRLNMTKYGWKAFVPLTNWTAPSPIITGFSPGHDARLLTLTPSDEPSNIDIEVRFSDDMDCSSFKDSVSVNSTTDFKEQAILVNITCSSMKPYFEAYYYGPSPSVWRATAILSNAYDGIHVINIKNVSARTTTMMSTNSHDHFLLRIGQADNPIVFPFTANYSTSLLYQSQSQSSFPSLPPSLHIHHKAPGSTLWRYSLSFGAVWSSWYPYIPGNASLHFPVPQGQISPQTWPGTHIQIQYWSKPAGSSNHLIQGDLVNESPGRPPRRFPHFFVHGSWNEYGFDAGIPNEMTQLENGTWKFDLLAEWPSEFQLNVWGMAKDGLPDLGAVFGDVDGDGVMDRVSPRSLEKAVVNITGLGPGGKYLVWRVLFNDGDLRYTLVPVGNRWVQMGIWIVLGLGPIGTAILGVWGYVRFFYGFKFNKIGLVEKERFSFAELGSRIFARERFDHDEESSDEEHALEEAGRGAQIDGAEDSIIRTMTVASRRAEPIRRTVLIATIEYDIADWNIKVKIGGLGVMAQMMGKNLTHQDLIWVVPCCGDIDYPLDDPAIPIEVTILGRAYDIQAQYHTLNNITYVLLDAPIFRRQTSKDPYPARMDDLDSSVYYSAWNQSIAEVARRFPIDLYHINDYHGAIAPLYLLPETALPCCLSLHNAEFQGLWSMRTPREIQEVCNVFNLPESIVSRYVQFGEVFNLLHAGASILRIHQKGFGAVGVSKKYGKRSWARYPIFWGLKRIGALPNPDPNDVDEWDRRKAVRSLGEEVVIDWEFEEERKGFRLLTQEWAGLDRMAEADLFCFVGRWSMQKGIDLIADVFPALLEAFSHVQLLCIGPPIDLYGKFAALKLGKMMEKYPGRVCSKPEFTALPPYVFSGAEFALIPSRDEPFGLVAVEFGRKGVLGVGSRVGGLGQMPGWWYTIESSTTNHHMHQFKAAISAALKSDYETRAKMRARSAKQRFPVAQWIEDLEILQASSINMHNKCKERLSRRWTGSQDRIGASSRWSTPGWMTPRSGTTTPAATRSSSPDLSRSTSPSRHKNSTLSLGLRHGPGHSAASPAGRSSVLDPTTPDLRRTPDGCPPSTDEQPISPEMAAVSRQHSQLNLIPEDLAIRDDHHLVESSSPRHPHSDSPALTPRGLRTSSRNNSPALDILRLNAQTPLSTDLLLLNDSSNPQTPTQNLVPFFTDSTGSYSKSFSQKLQSLSGKTSETTLCIEKFLLKSEKQWFNQLHLSRMSRPTPPSSHPPSPSSLPPSSPHQTPRGLPRLMLYRLKGGDWPIYSLLLALGQILAANSYQITLLSGQVGQTPSQLYIIASIYLFATICWWVLFRRCKAVYCLSLPWAFYGLGFGLLGLAQLGGKDGGGVKRGMQHAATGLYAVGSASGSLFFAQNFGSLGSAPVKDWAWRACAVQGSQQLYVVGLWAWGERLVRLEREGRLGIVGGGGGTREYAVTAVGLTVGLMMWVVGFGLYFGLPDYYRQKPGGVPDFYCSVFRRRIVVWSLVAILVQNLFLSAPYGRNWSYLWSSKHVAWWVVLLLVVFFFVVVWTAMLLVFGRLSATHSWIIPIFAIGLGAPRWAQTLWSTSNIGQYLPWAGSPVASALLGRGLWLWLGVLDSLQGIGFGMILLQTMIRFHCTFALMTGQVVGAIATIIARADGLNSLGPGPTFPSFAVDIGQGLAEPWFWVCLLLQIAICVGFFAFFRKEQLTKP